MLASDEKECGFDGGGGPIVTSQKERTAQRNRKRRDANFLEWSKRGSPRAGCSKCRYAPRGCRTCLEKIGTAKVEVKVKAKKRKRDMREDSSSSEGGDTYYAQRGKAAYQARARQKVLADSERHRSQIATALFTRGASIFGLLSPAGLPGVTSEGDEASLEDNIRRGRDAEPIVFVVHSDCSPADAPVGGDTTRVRITALQLITWVSLLKAPILRDIGMTPTSFKEYVADPLPPHVNARSLFGALVWSVARTTSRDERLSTTLRRAARVIYEMFPAPTGDVGRVTAQTNASDSGEHEEGDEDEEEAGISLGLGDKRDRVSSAETARSERFSTTLRRGARIAKPTFFAEPKSGDAEKGDRSGSEEDSGDNPSNSVSGEDGTAVGSPFVKMYRRTRRLAKRPRKGISEEVLRQTIESRKRRVPSWSKYFREIDTSANGNCFFNAVHSAIKTARREDEMVIRQSFLRNSSTDTDARHARVKWTPQLLRAIVASSVIDMEDDKTVLNIVRTWTELSQVTDEDGRAIGELKHMRHVEGRFGSARWRASMARVLLDRHLYWAEELSVYVVEMLLNVRFLVVEGGRIDFTVDHGPDFRPDYFITLLRSGQHYSLLQHKDSGKSVFEFDTIPAVLRKMAPPSAAYWYVRLDKKRDEDSE